MCIHWLHFGAMKDVGLRIRVQRDLREAFLTACRNEDKPAAQVLREFMRNYVQKNNSGQQARLNVTGDKADRKQGFDGSS